MDFETLSLDLKSGQDPVCPLSEYCIVNIHVLVDQYHNLGTLLIYEMWDVGQSWHLFGDTIKSFTPMIGLHREGKFSGW